MPLTLPSAMYRAWRRSRSELAYEWCSENVGSWDAAVRCSAYVRAAVLRSVKDELCSAGQNSCATLLVYVTKCYGTAAIPLLAKVAMRRGVLATVLGMPLMQQLAPRRSRVAGACSKPSQVWNSVMAGGGQVLHMARIVLHACLVRARPCCGACIGSVAMGGR